MSSDFNLSEMTDEELMNADDTDFIPTEGEVLEDTENKSEEVTEEIEGEQVAEEGDDTAEESETKEEDTEEAIQPDLTEEGEANATDNKEPDTEALSPLRANGRDITLNSIEELRQLASMGANYNKKMQDIKPKMKILRTLEAQNLLDEDSINHLIALKKGDKNAIAKLLKDSGIDLSYDDLPQATDDYTPDDFTISDSELALDDVLEELKSSEHYSATMDILGNKWDEASRSIVAGNPASVRTVHEHVANGMYSKIWGEVERQRMLGSLNSQSDVEAYDIVGKAMQEQGAFNTEPQESTAKKQKRVKARKGAASSPNRKNGKKPIKKQLSNEAIMSMTDEEIDAITIPGLF
jgi:hypothetical protein